jgi:SAM-dependent methyltransferase
MVKGMDGIRRLNWGCGDDPPAGWVNSDLVDASGVDITCDIREGLPVDDDWFDYVVSIHALPMIRYPDLVPVLTELRRVLKPGGVLRLGLPDVEKGIQALLRGDREYFLVPDDEVRSMGGKFVVHMLWYGWSVTMFTADFIEELLMKAGFRSVAHCRYRESSCRLPGIVELDDREAESLFVEAVE